MRNRSWILFVGLNDGVENLMSNLYKLFDMNTLKILSFISAISCLQLNAQDKQIFINYYSDSKVETSQTFPLNSGAVKDSRSQQWQIDVDSLVVNKHEGIVDYIVKYTLLGQNASQVSVGVNFDFEDWSAENFVFVPSIVYNGNRFDKKVMNYPPYWYDKKEWRLDMPTTTPLVPSLEK